MKPSIAFIGLGIMGHRMLAGMARHDGFNLAAAWDPSPEQCRAVTKMYPGIRIGATALEIITAPDIDVVYIASPPHSHREYALAAASAGKVVYCEKPLGVDLADSQSLVDAVEAAGALNCVNFPFIDSQAINKIEAGLKDGSIGDVTGVDLVLHFSKWPRDWQHSASWLSLRDEGGFVREVVSHYVYLIEKLFGPTTLRDASVHYPADKTLCETSFFAGLDCGHVPVSFVGGAGGVGPDRVEFTVWGSKRSYRLWDWVNLKSSTGGEWQEELAHVEDLRGDGNMRVLNNFLGMIRGNTHTMAPLRSALSVQKIIEDMLDR